MKTITTTQESGPVNHEKLVTSRHYYFVIRDASGFTRKYMHICGFLNKLICISTCYTRANDRSSCCWPCSTTTMPSGILSKDMHSHRTPRTHDYLLPPATKKSKILVVIFFHNNGFIIGSVLGPPCIVAASTSLLPPAGHHRGPLWYRLVPKHPISVAYEYFLTTLNWALSHGRSWLCRAWRLPPARMFLVNNNA
jgi:hypothetical protein